jgi:hypothetical protein
MGKVARARTKRDRIKIGPEGLKQASTQQSVLAELWPLADSKRATAIFGIATGRNIEPNPAMNGITDLTSAECRLNAEAKLALAERSGAAREALLADAQAWLLLADYVGFVESVMAATRRSLH